MFVGIPTIEKRCYSKILMVAKEKTYKFIFKYILQIRPAFLFEVVT